VAVDAMTSGQALAMLTRGVPGEISASFRLRLTALAVRLGEWASLLALANSVLRARIAHAATGPRMLWPMPSERLLSVGSPPLFRPGSRSGAPLLGARLRLAWSSYAKRNAPASPNSPFSSKMPRSRWAPS
jgi:hypothetical protein